MSKLKTIGRVLAILKVGAEVYDTIMDGRQKQKDITKDRKIAELEAEVEQLKKKLEDK